MVISNYKKIEPAGDMVLVEMVKLDKIIDGIITETESTAENIEIRYGKVIAMGKLANSEPHCPSLKEEEIVVFTQFAGYFIATKEQVMIKLIRGYDIIGKYENEDDMKENKLIPTADRLLVEEYDINEGSDLVMSSLMKDPRLTDLSFGKIIGVGPAVKNKDLKDGLIVAYAPYVGTTIREKESDEDKPLKTIVEFDILMTMEE